MRKVTSSQVAALTASVGIAAPTGGLIGAVIADGMSAARLGLPAFSVTTLASLLPNSAYAVPSSAGELEEIIISAGGGGGSPVVVDISGPIVASNSYQMVHSSGGWHLLRRK